MKEEKEKKTCDPFKHEWIEVYYGLECKNCDAFLPDNDNYFAPNEEQREVKHGRMD